MLIARKVLPDLKSVRPGVTPPLPPYLRIVPIAFYLATLGGAAFAVLFFLQMRAASDELKMWQSRSAASRQQLENTRREHASLEARAKRAGDLQAWVEGSRPLQPLAAGIGRSLTGNASLTALNLSRDPQNPGQIRLALQIQANQPKQVDQILEAVTRAQFRSYRADRKQDKDLTDYSATLIWQPSVAVAAPAEPMP